jgi:O-succinylbenzoic acid--CoA ligase
VAGTVVTLVDWLGTTAAGSPDAPALIAGAGVVSYADLDAAASAVAAALTGSGIEPGARVAVWGTPEPRTVAALWGIPRAGAEAVVLTPGLPAMHAARLAADAGAAAMWDRVDDGLGPAGRTAFAPFRWGPPAESRLVVFTSGSSSTPRGVVITGAMVEASVEASRRRLGNGPGDRWLCALPLSHVAGLSVLWRAAREGAAVVLERWFDAWRSAQLLAGGEVACASLVPTMLRRVLDTGPEHYGRGVKAVLVGGGPVEAGLIERALDAGLPALQTYGMTETVGQVTTVAPGEERELAGTAGRPLDGVEVRVVSHAGVAAAPGEPGRIEVRGPTVTPGYLGEPDRSPRAWFRTGDLGVLGDNGALTVLGRADDVIVTGGENVHPVQVEEVLRGFPGVVDVRVYGEEDEEWGRVVAADIVLDRDLLGEVQARARDALPGFMVPKRWHSVSRIERTWKG